MVCVVKLDCGLIPQSTQDAKLVFYTSNIACFVLR